MTRIARQAHLERDYSQVKPERLRLLGIVQPVGVWTPENEAVIECAVTGNCVSYYELVSDFYVPDAKEIEANCERFRKEWAEDRREIEYFNAGERTIGGRHYSTGLASARSSRKELFIAFIE